MSLSPMPGDARPQALWVVARDVDAPDTVRYIRGDQIIEVRREGEVEPGEDGPARVVATVAYPTDGDGPEGRQITLWTVPATPAAHAAHRLAEILTAAEPGLVVLTNDEEDDDGPPRVEWHSPTRGARDPR